MADTRTMPQSAQAVLREAAVPLTGGAGDYDELLDLIGDARVVCLGEATHGTHEFYRERARITQRLVEEKGFAAVAVEADWPDAYRVNRFVRGRSDDTSAIEALGDFERFPRWMWRNRDVVDLVTWLRDYNSSLPQDARRVGFYGLDLYSLFGSIEAVLRYLDAVDPAAARRARYRYACFEHFGEDSQAYGYAAEFGMSRPCEDEAVQQLLELQRRAGELAAQGSAEDEDERFFAEQNARLVVNAEEYYRTMFRGRISSWNLRDRHMAETLDALMRHFERPRGSDGASSGLAEPARVVVWEHNSHLGDARATDMGDAGEWNVGQLARERWGRDAVLVGFTTYQGTVTAASDWDAPAERKRVRPGHPDSYETLFHGVGIRDFLLPIRDDRRVREVLKPPRLERAIGVVYLPRTERVSHYFHADLAEQFDAVIHFDETRAVEPLDRSAGWDEGEPPETYPTGL
ncbi:MAG TPA: erythromycin esterase family protein [Gemmatimonadales bacterium]|nr:erythromycin esterase family protein [Gemmatimonadales bacterium]